MAGLVSLQTHSRSASADMRLPTIVESPSPKMRQNADGDEEEQVYVADEMQRQLLSEEGEALNDSGSQLNGSFADPAYDHPPTGYFRTFVNFIKGNLGTGILAVPDAIKNAGLVFGSVALIFIGLLATYCCHQLLRAYRQVSADKAISYANVVDLVFRRATGRLKRLAKPARFTINAVLVSTQIGYCSVYILFCSRMIKEVVDSYYPVPEDRHSVQFYETLLTIFLIPYCFITTLNAISIFATFANIVTAVCIFVVMQYVFRNLQPVSEVNLFPTSFESTALFFGTSMFTFESISLILPIENRMKDRQRFHGWNGLLSMSMLFIVTLYVTVGFFGYLAFGQNAQMILTNMPKEVWIYQLVKLMYALCIVISFNLQLYVPVQIMLPKMKARINRHWFNRFGEYLLRTALVLTTYFLALNIPCLEYMISLFGAFASSWLALILPPIVEVVSCLHPGQRHRLTCWLLLKCSAICLFGLFGCTVGTIVSLKAIATALDKPGGCST